MRPRCTSTPECVPAESNPRRHIRRSCLLIFADSFLFNRNRPRARGSLPSPCTSQDIMAHFRTVVCGAVVLGEGGSAKWLNDPV